MTIPVTSLAALDGTAGFRRAGGDANDRIDTSVSDAGDVNGAGFCGPRRDDFSVTARNGGKA